MATERLCSVADCGKPHWAKGYCNTHYRRMYRRDTLAVRYAPQGAALKFLEEVAVQYDGDECLVWPYKQSTTFGYGLFRYNGKRWMAHRYVCLKSSGLPPSPKHYAAHFCGNPKCCSPKHIRWATPKENSADKLLHGTSNKGEMHGNSKLTSCAVQRIRELNGKRSITEIARQFDVSRTTVRKILDRKTWLHI